MGTRLGLTPHPQGIVTVPPGKEGEWLKYYTMLQNLRCVEESHLLFYTT